MCPDPTHASNETLELTELLSPQVGPIQTINVAAGTSLQDVDDIFQEAVCMLAAVSAVVAGAHITARSMNGSTQYVYDHR
jgi:hypothetical protein